MTLTYLIDTDWVAHYFEGRPNIVARLHDLRGQGLGISVVTLAELYDFERIEGIRIESLPVA